VIQWKYVRTSALPEQAPAEFRIADDTGKAVDGASRLAYWSKLREIWLKAENWHTTYSFDMSWMTNDVQFMSRAILNFVRDHM
jgi:hypothetical protein